jgi:hypothetical protein
MSAHSRHVAIVKRRHENDLPGLSKIGNFVVVLMEMFSLVCLRFVYLRMVDLTTLSVAQNITSMFKVFNFPTNTALFIIVMLLNFAIFFEGHLRFSGIL